MPSCWRNPVPAKSKRRKRQSWEARQLGEINRYWDRSPLHGRPMGMTRESERTVAVQRIRGTQSRSKTSSRT